VHTNYSMHFPLGDHEFSLLCLAIVEVKYIINNRYFIILLHEGKSIFLVKLT